MKTIDDLKRELEELKSRAATPALSDEEKERARLREEMAKERAKVERKELEARNAREDELFDELESTLASEDFELHRIDTTAGMIVLRTPAYAKSRHFQQIVIKGKLSPDAVEDFVRPNVVHPKGAEFEEMIEKYPLLAATLASFAQEIGSAAAERRAKK